MTPKSISVSGSGMNIVSPPAPTQLMLMYFQQVLLALYHIFHGMLLLVQARAYVLFWFFFFSNCMSYMVLNMKDRDFLALQVWISSSGFTVVSFNENKMPESNLSN